MLSAQALQSMQSMQSMWTLHTEPGCIFLIEVAEKWKL